MKVSINWVRFINQKYQCSADPMPSGIDALVEKIGAQLGAVDEVTNVGKKYEGIVIAKVVSCQKHPNADKLSVCLIDDGRAVKKVKRNKTGLVEVVCGAPNVAAGQLVAWMPPGVTVPSTLGNDPLVLEAREIRGVISNGMIASEKELAIGEDHKGILVLEDTNSKIQTSNFKLGNPLAEALGLDDHIIDIENKMFTHRPDLFGQLGIARELAGIHSHVFKSPAWYSENLSLPKPNGAATHQLIIKNKIPKLVPRFTAVVLKDIKVGPSPLWLRVRLSNVGVKSINNIVDITNFLMLETAQPLHAYDYDKLVSGSIETRLAKPGEALTVIGDKKIKLNKEDIVIASGGKVIGLGGVMGGADTEVSKTTKNIALEVANFDLNSVRRTAMQYGLFTEAAIRFTKNQSPRQNLAVLVRAIDEIKKLAGGRQASKVVDDNQSTLNAQRSTVKTNAEFINQRLGLKLTAAQIKKILENVEFEVRIIDKKPTTPQSSHLQGGSLEILQIDAPFWRTDIEIAEDIVEEVGRLYGYDHLPLKLPFKDLEPATRNNELDLKQRIREILSAAGANEVLTYSFVNSSLLESAGQVPKNAYHIRNALSPDLQYYRQSLTPSLLEKVHPNIKDGLDNFVLFEIGQGHVKGVLDNEKLPRELPRLALVIAKNKTGKDEGSPYYHAKGYLSEILNKLSILGVTHKSLTSSSALPEEWRVAASSYEPKRSAVVYCKDKIIGLVGEPTQTLRQTLKLPNFTAQAEVDTRGLQMNTQPPQYYPLNKFPAVAQDLCLRTAVDISYNELTNLAAQALGKMSEVHGYKYSLSPVDIYQRPTDKAHKQTTWHIILEHPRRTLTMAETNKVLDKIASVAKSKFKAERI